MSDRDSLLARLRSFMEARLILTAAEHDLFTTLGERWLTASELASERNLEPEPLAVVLDALAALGLLSKRDGGYATTPGARSLLTADSPDSVLPVALHQAHLWSTWSRLSARLVPPGTSHIAPDRTRSFIGAMDTIARPQAEEIVATVNPRGVRRVLDVGGASGTYTQAFLDALPEARATLFDLASVIPLARERLGASGHAARVHFVAGDYGVDDFPPGHDLVFLSAIVHSVAPDRLTALFRKAHDALVAGGRLVIRDYVMAPDRTTPVGGAIFAVNMLVNETGGRTYTLAELEAALRAAGFVRVALFAPNDTMNAMVEAFRPEIDEA